MVAPSPIEWIVTKNSWVRVPGTGLDTDSLPSLLDLSKIARVPPARKLNIHTIVPSPERLFPTSEGGTNEQTGTDNATVNLSSSDSAPAKVACLKRKLEELKFENQKLRTALKRYRTSLGEGGIPPDQTPQNTDREEASMAA